MNKNNLAIKRALISVSNKEGIVDFAKGLHDLGVEIVSTGGTAKLLAEVGILVKDISSFTGFPEMMNGRVKTLHPKVHGGILGRRDQDAAVAAQNNIEWIDLVVCNLYPFAETIQKQNVYFDEIIENIDIGGPTMIRSAAKNMGWVTVVVDPGDYQPMIEELRSGGVSFATRKRLATKAFGHTAQYDTLIHTHLSSRAKQSEVEGSLAEQKGDSSPSVRNDDHFPDKLQLQFSRLYDLRYGENPHQRAAVYRDPAVKHSALLDAKILQGKQLSYNNLNDADGALSCLQEFTEPACVVVKHANPCGVAVAGDINTAFRSAYEADALAAFGGIIALNRPCTKEIAEYICTVFAEIVLAPNFTVDALALFAAKKNLRLLELGNIGTPTARLEIREVIGGLLVQDANVNEIVRKDLKCVTKKQPTDAEYADMLFGWKVLKHVKSNAIVLAKESVTAGIGPGQVSRVDSVYTALRKANTSPPVEGGDHTSGASGQRGSAEGAVLCSDAFFPFRDSIDIIAPAGITAIIQPGGSIKDQEVINACDEHDISMVFTGIRCFKH